MNKLFNCAIFLSAMTACAMEPQAPSVQHLAASQLAAKIVKADEQRCTLEDSLEGATQERREEIEPILDAQDKILSDLFGQAIDLGYYTPNPYLLVQPTQAELRPAVLDVSAQTGDASAALKLGLEFASRFNDEQAFAYLERAFAGGIDTLIKSAKDDAQRAKIADGLNRLGGYVFASGDQERARRLFAYVLDLGSEDFGACWEHGMRCLEAGDAQSAPLIRQALNKAPRPLVCDMRVQAGIEFFNRHESSTFCREQAGAFLTDAARQSNMRANDYLVVLHHENGNSKAALMRAVQHTAPIIKDLFLCPRLGCGTGVQIDARVEKLGLTNAVTERIGLCYQRVGASDGAVRVWNNIPVKKRSSAVSYELANYLLQKNEPLKALEHAVRLIKQDPENTSGLKDKLIDAIEVRVKNDDGATLFLLTELLLCCQSPAFVVSDSLRERTLAYIERIVSWAAHQKQLRRLKESALLRALRVWADGEHVASQAALAHVFNIFWRELDGCKQGTEAAQLFFKYVAKACAKDNLDAIELVARAKAELAEVPGVEYELPALCGVLATENHRAAPWALEQLERLEKTDLDARVAYVMVLLKRAKTGDVAAIDKALALIEGPLLFGQEKEVAFKQWSHMMRNAQDFAESLDELAPLFESIDCQRAGHIHFTRILCCTKTASRATIGSRLQTAIALGYNKARIGLARMSIDSWGCIDDGKRYLQEAIAQGSKEARVWLDMYTIAWADFSKNVRLPEVDAALADLKELARDFVHAKVVYARMCLNRPVAMYLMNVRGVSSDTLRKEREHWLEVAAQAGDLSASIDMCEFADNAHARGLLQKAAVQGDRADAYLHLAYLLRTGDGGPRDPKKAHECVEHAANSGDAAGQMENALDLLVGSGLSGPNIAAAQAMLQVARDGVEHAAVHERCKLRLAFQTVLAVFIFEDALPAGPAYDDILACGGVQAGDVWARRCYALDMLADAIRRNGEQKALVHSVLYHVIELIGERAGTVVREAAPSDWAHVRRLGEKIHLVIARWGSTSKESL